MGATTDPYEALVSSIADTLWELTGNLIVRTTAAAVAGATTISVESTDRWASSGRVVAAGVVYTYASLTTTTLVGLAQLDGTPGLADDLKVRSVVMEWGRQTTDMDKLRGSFVTRLADGVELDTLGRNYGLDRPRGVSDATWRALLETMIYLDAQTMWACEKVLTALLGAGNYTVYERLEEYPFTVFVELATAVGAVSTGRAFLVGGDAQTRTSATTVDVDYPPVVVYGVYDATDPFREGENYANQVLTGLATSSAAPDRVSSGAFVAGDVGSPLLWRDGSGEHWTIATYVSATEVAVSGPTRADGSVASGGDTLTTTRDWWRAWHVGHSITIAGSSVGNDGTYVIAAVLSPREVQLTGAAFNVEAVVTYTLEPTFPTESSLELELPRATVAGSTITTPRNMPADVLVDYTTVPSAEILESSLVDGADRYPFYFYDGLATAVALLDLITAAGVRVVAIPLSGYGLASLLLE